ncbi:synaptic vesicle glycoprotein 2A-like [Malaya genurostris]|uniref:synaptic vesicle glycoprotein 2A-like n=1 Tax=Malaya genurostris TaxID=325434 RepID=UPI0026F3B7D7|nr:synaptic vesicle glycoprotein 2A-like [Malaya genurostris]
MTKQDEKSIGKIFTIEALGNDNKKVLEVKSHSFDEAIKLVGFGRISQHIFLMSALVIQAVSNETMGISILVPAAHCDLNLSATDKGMLTGVSFAGIILTLHLWGYLADTKGRKNVIIISLILNFLCSLLSSMAGDFVTMVILRLLVGMCISAPSATIYAYLGEFTNTEKRTMIISFASVAVGLSSIFTGALGWLVLSFDWRVDLWGLVEFRPWRLLLILYSLPGAIAGVWMIFLPESPKFYLSQGRDDLALKVLQNMFLGNNAGATLDEFSVRRITPEVCEDDVGKQRKGFLAVLCGMWNQTTPLFRRPNLLYFIVCCALQFGMYFVSAGMGLWYPEIINQLTSVVRNNSEGICDIIEDQNDSDKEFALNEVAKCDDHMTQDVFIYVIVLGSIYAVSYLAVSAVLRKVKRGYILFFNLFISGTFGMLLLFIDNMYLVLMLFCSFMVFAGVSISLVNGAAVSIFPTNVRAMAVGLSLMMGRLGSVAGTNLIGLIMERNCTMTFVLFAASSLMGAVLTLILPRR